ncbi:MAG: hypothetical protein R3324_11815, partial [Halobacteriales archaeon]|nr:hypothetical protein [Halobacteriales archaeon]
GHGLGASHDPVGAEDQKDEAIQTFRTMAWHAAKRRGLKIRTWTEGDELMMVARKRAVVED